MRVLHVAGSSGCGKTRLIEKLVACLPVVLVVKWSHHALGPEKPGADSARFKALGVSALLAAPDGLVLRPSPTARHTVYQFLAQALREDALIIVEGDKTAPYPKIWMAEDLPAHARTSLVIGPKRVSAADWLAANLPLSDASLDRVAEFICREWTRYTYFLGDADEKLHRG